MSVNQSILPFSRLKPMNEILEAVFSDCFFDTYQTLLVGGGEEPIYLPAKSAGESHRLIYREDFSASAFHEIAHWCVAGDRRRTLVDFGYWYVPDGRHAEQQRSFERVEIKPQALEWIFSEAAGICFGVSVDNLDGLSAQGGMEERMTKAFSQAVLKQVNDYCARGLPSRAERFAKEVARVFDSGNIFDHSRYTLDDFELNSSR